MNTSCIPIIPERFTWTIILIFQINNDCLTIDFSLLQWVCGFYAGQRKRFFPSEVPCAARFRNRPANNVCTVMPTQHRRATSPVCSCNCAKSNRTLMGMIMLRRCCFGSNSLLRTLLLAISMVGLIEIGPSFY